MVNSVDLIRPAQPGDKSNGTEPVFASIVLFFLDPIIGQAFAAPLKDPAFASSMAAPVWGLLPVVFDFHGDIILMWIRWILSLVG
jgi:hypothetical protein